MISQTVWRTNIRSGNSETSDTGERSKTSENNQQLGFVQLMLKVNATRPSNWGNPRLMHLCSPSGQVGGFNLEVTLLRVWAEPKDEFITR